MSVRASTAPSQTLGRLLELTVSLFSAAAGVIHIAVAGQHLAHPLQAGAFLSMGAGQLGLAGLIALRSTRRLLFAAVLGNVAIVSIWAVTRVTGIPFVDGLEVPQQVGVADIMATLLEVGLVSAALVRLAVPAEALRFGVLNGERARIGIGAAALLLMVPGLLAGHTHAAGHHAGLALAHAQADHAAADAHPIVGAKHHAPLSWDQAQDALTSHAHDATGMLADRASHEHGGNTALGATAPGKHRHDGGDVSPGADGTHSHDAGANPARTEHRVLELGEGYVAYEPPTADGTHGPAFRWHGGQAAGHHTHPGDCRPTSAQQAAADAIARDMERSLRRYNNDPWQALRDGFVAYPIPLSKMFHMVAPGRFNDGHTVDAVRVESFMYGMTDEGLTAFGGMFIFPERKLAPPNPTGCLLVWHKHTGGEGLVTSFDPRSPDESMWMAHVWTYGGLDPWGRDYDGTEPHTWFFAYRNIPALCPEDGECF